MTEKDFDKKIGDRLRNYEERPENDVYSRIEKTLARNAAVTAAPAKRVLKPLYRYVSAAAAIMLIITAGIYFTRHTATITLPDNTVADTTYRSNGDSGNAADNKKTITDIGQTFSEMQSGNVTAHTESSYRTVQAVRPDETAHTTVMPHSENTLPVIETTENSGSGIEETTADDLPKIYRPKRSEIPSRYENRFTAQSAGTGTPSRTQNRRQLISGSVYAGNTGAGRGDLSTREQDMVASANMLIKQSFDEAVPCAYGLTNTEDGCMMPVAENLNTQDASLNHRMPISAGVSLALSLNDRLSLTTGLNYTYLYSSSSQNFTSGSSNITRELHYIGIPVGVAYTFLRNGNFSLYSQGGGMIEKAVAWHETYGISTSLDQNTEKANYHVKGVQMSINLSAGASYYVSRNISLYVEPGISYYFPQRYQPANYRTVHPVSFSLRAGIRFGK